MTEENQENFGIKEFMQEFKNFLDHEGIGADTYSDEAYEMVELMSLYDSFVQQVMAARQQIMEEQAKNVEEEKSNSKIVTPNNVTKGDFRK